MTRATATATMTTTFMSTWVYCVEKCNVNFYRNDDSGGVYFDAVVVR